MPFPPPQVPVTTVGGSVAGQSEGPLRPGLIPKRVEYPFVAPPFYNDARRQCMRHSFPQSLGRALVKREPVIRVRQKTVQAAGGNGVWIQFARKRG